MMKPNMPLFTAVWRSSHVSGLFLCSFYFILFCFKYRDEMNLTAMHVYG